MSKVNKAAFWIIFGVVFIDLLGFGIVFPLLPLYARFFKISEFEIGLVLGIYSLMQFVFAPILGRLSDRVGRRPVLLVSMAGTALSFFLLALSNNFWWFLIARAFDGIAGSNLATAQAYIADISPKEQRTRNLGMWIGAAFGLGFAFGPFIGGGLHWVGQIVWAEHALRVPFIGAGILATINFLFAVFKLPESLTQRDSEHMVGRRTFSLSHIHQHITGGVGLLIVCYALVILSFSHMEATFSWIANDLFRLTSNSIYLVFGYLGIVMAFVQGGLVRRLAPILGDKNLTVLGCILMVIGLIALPLLKGIAGLLFTTGLLAVGESFCNPALISSISKGAQDSLQGETMGVSQSLASLSRFAGPVFAGFLYQHYGPTSPYFIAALVMIFALVVGLAGFKQTMTPDDKNPLPV